MHIRLTRIRLGVAIAAVVALVPATAVATHVFSDVDDSRFFAAAVEWASENKITTGTSATTFDPDRGVTRGESVTFLNRYDTNVVKPAIAAAAPRLLTTAIVDDEVASTTSETFSPIPDTKLDVVVPPGGSWRALITFSGESTCSQDPLATVWCWVQTVVDPVASVDCFNDSPPTPPGCALPLGIVFDSVEHGANSTDTLAVGTHSQQWTHVLSPGTHTIEMQWRVDEPNATFEMSSRLLSVQLYPV